MQEKDVFSHYIAAFWEAPEDAYLDEDVTGAVIKKGKSWFQKQRAAGTSIPYTRVGRDFFYQKRDVVKKLEKNRSDRV